MSAPSEAPRDPRPPGSSLPAGASLDRPYGLNAHNVIPHDVPYPCLRWRWINPETGEVRPYRCRSWRCPKCTPALVDRWTALIREAPIRRHIMLSALGPTPEIARRRFSHITQGIRRGELGATPRRPWQHEWFAALESHQSAGYHVHLLQWGRYLPQRPLSSLSARYGAGRVVWARALKPADQPEHVHRYVIRHLVGVEHPGQHKPGRRIRYSRNFWDGSTRQEITDRLWPPDDSAPWVLDKPDVRARQAEYELFLQAKSASRQRIKERWDLATLRHHLARGCSYDQLQAAGILRPYSILLDPHPEHGDFS